MKFKFRSFIKLIRQFKFAEAFSLIRIYVFSLSTIGFLFLYIGEENNIVDMSHDIYGQLSVFEHFSQFLLLLSVVTFLWYVIKFLTNEENANEWQKFIGYTLPVTFLVVLLPEDKTCSWFCPSNATLFLVFSFMVYMPFTIYRIVRGLLARVKINTNYQILLSIVVAILPLVIFLVWIIKY